MYLCLLFFSFLNSQVDLPVEASLDVSMFPDKEEVKRLLKSYGFQTADLPSGQVCVKGTFMMLIAVKAHMEKLLNSQTQDNSSSSSLIVNGHGHSSGAIPKNHNNGSSMHAGNRSPLVGDQPLYALPSPPISSSSRGSPYIQPSSSEYEGAQSPRQDHQPFPRPDSESFVIDTYLLDYAQRFKKTDITDILRNHNTTMNVTHAGPDTSKVILSGKNVKIPEGKLQSLLSNLTKTLYTQEIPLANLDSKSQEKVAQQIKKYEYIYRTVLVRQVGDTVRLVGPSVDSYEFKQRVLGKPVDQTAGVRPGRTMDKSSRLRSRSLPKTPMKHSTDRVHDDTSKPQPAEARHYSPTRYQDERGRGAVVEPGAVKSSGILRGRSHSESREKVWEQKASLRQEKENTKPATGQTSPLDRLKKAKWLKPITDSFRPKKR